MERKLLSSSPADSRSAGLPCFAQTPNRSGRGGGPTRPSLYCRCMPPDDPIAWWYGRIDYERRAPQADDLNLDQMRSLLRLLGEPQRRLRIVHIAGSKGKGSTAAMLACTLRSAGYRTGLFTSPHLC